MTLHTRDSGHIALQILHIYVPIYTMYLAFQAPAMEFNFTAVGNWFGHWGQLSLWGVITGGYLLLFTDRLFSSLPGRFRLEKAAIGVSAIALAAAAILPTQYRKLTVSTILHSIAARLAPICLIGAALLLSIHLRKMDGARFNVLLYELAAALIFAGILYGMTGISSILELYAVLAAQVFFLSCQALAEDAHRNTIFLKSNTKHCEQQGTEKCEKQ